MPTPINRESLAKDLETRYDTQRAGGAYDAKTIPNALADNMSNEFADGFTKGGQDTKLPKKPSIYVFNIDTTKYHP